MPRLLVDLEMMSLGQHMWWFFEAGEGACVCMYVRDKKRP